MTTLNCIKPGVKPGQVILAVDLSIAGKVDDALARLQEMGYKPEIRHVAYRSGVHVLAVVKDEHHETVKSDYLMDEWRQLRTQINPSAVLLWRGKSPGE
jgi:hypothetical protein